MIRRMLLLFASILCACGGGGRTRTETVAPAGPREGVYEYLANLPSQQVRGTLRVAADTITVDPTSDYCRINLGPPDPLSIKYTCTGTGSYESIQLVIDRRNPAQLSKWIANFRVTRRREVCAQYAVRDGRQVCVQTTTETYETTESRSGTLQIRRTSG